MRKIIAIYLVLLTTIVSYAQKTKSDHQKIYKINYKSELPLTLGLYAINYYGFGVIKRKPVLDSTQATALDKNNVWAFDRIVLNQSSSQYIVAHETSDVAMNITLFMPALLFLDKEMRKDWIDIIALYLETQAINSNLYTWTGPILVDRSRPLVYFDDIPMEERTASGTSSSFFSGHTSWTAGASFFMAKVISDYHPELGNKKFLIYAAALIPSVIVGYYRMRALKHFPTDIITGIAIGAATGILVPHFHKIVKSKNKNLSLVPYVGGYSGLVVSLKF